MELCTLLNEPLRTPGLYVFRDSDLARRARDRSFEALTRHRIQQPPPEILFLHRKLIGSFLLCAHIGAEVDVHAIYEELVSGSS
jgi:hypothetical protein